MFTFLHISDIHRSPDDPISNKELISSLIIDSMTCRKEQPSVSPPDAIVVSGDLVRGVPLHCSNYRSALKDQYEIALEFLLELAQRFLDGDRSRVIIVPGNHDVDWNIAWASMIEESSVPEDVRKLLRQSRTPFRWSWEDRKLYRVIDQEKYNERFRYFRDLVKRFYKDLTLTYPINPDSYYNLFELDKGRIAVAAFNSCYDNDCFSDTGDIPFEAISESHMRLHDGGSQYALRVAVWHHSVEGAPRSSDFMNPDIVRVMIHRGFRLGLNGHQHKGDATPYTLEVFGEQRMVVVSAGSLCAGPCGLPPGVHRQYNIIEINDVYNGARIHVREMMLPRIFTAGRLYSLGARSYVDIGWTLEPRLETLPRVDMPARVRNLVLRAETELHKNRLEEVLELLGPIREELNPYGRRIVAAALHKAKKWPDIIVYFGEPRNTDEITSLVRARTEVGDYDGALRDLERFADTVDLPQANRSDLTSWVNAQKELR